MSDSEWRTTAFVLAGGYVGQAALFDWSDVRGKTALACLLVVTSMRWPRPASAVLAALVATAVLLQVAEGARTADLAASVRPGMSWADVQRVLGAPRHSAFSSAHAASLDIGYAVPSPIRFRHVGPVAVFTRGEYALWVFHDGTAVIDTFVGGS